MLSEQSTKQRIVDVAMALCQEQGVHALSFREIGERLGIRSASVHHHFRTKDDLVVALVRKYREDFTSGLLELDRTVASAGSKLKFLVEKLENCLVNQDRCCLCAVLAVESSSVCCNSQIEVGAFFKASTDWAKGVLEAGRGAGELRFEGDAAQAAGCLMAALNGMVIAARRLEGAKTFREMSAWYLSNLGVK